MSQNHLYLLRELKTDDSGNSAVGKKTRKNELQKMFIRKETLVQSPVYYH